MMTISSSKIGAIVCAVFLTLAVMATAVADAAEPVYIKPAEAVARVKAMHKDKGVEAYFEITVQSTHRGAAMVYLNSETNFRSESNLGVAMLPTAIRQFEAQYGVAPEVMLKGKTIRVGGEAIQVRYPESGGKSGYYYQILIPVASVQQLVVD